VSIVALKQLPNHIVLMQKCHAWTKLLYAAIWLFSVGGDPNKYLICNCGGVFLI
jgi:hypothetical protein